MIDATKLNPDWGYASLYGTGGKTSITKPPATQPTASVTPTATQGVSSGAATTTGGNAMADATFQYPDPWSKLGDIYGNMASGGYTNAGMDWLKNMMQSGGNAFDVSGFSEAYKPAMMDDYANMTRQMAEQAGVGGTRYGSGLQNSIANYGGQLQNQYNRDLWDRMFGAYESGQNRAAGAGNLLSQLGLSAATGGTSGLLGLGQAQGDYFNNAMSQMMGAGNYSNQMSIDPWTQMMGGFVGQPQYTPTTYQPTGMDNIFGVLSQIPWGDIFGGGGGGGSLSTTPGASIW